MNNSSQIPALFIINLNIKKEYKMMIYDLIRVAVIMIVVNLLHFLQDPAKHSFFSLFFFEFFIYILLGIASFWLIFTKLISIKLNDDDE